MVFIFLLVFPTWQVIQRRIDGSLDFGRHWEDYKEGFGFLSSEFWLGNDQVAFLTNQAQYELRVDVTIANETFSVRYDAFRLGDEWSNYAFVKVGIYEGDEGEWCLGIHISFSKHVFNRRPILDAVWHIHTCWTVEHSFVLNEIKKESYIL